MNGGLFLIFFNFALEVSTNVGALAIASQLSEPFALILGVLFLGERLSALGISGVVLALDGVTLLVFDPRIVNELPGLLLMTIAAAVCATSMPLQRCLGSVPIPVLHGWTGLMGALMLLPLSLLFEPGQLAAARGLGAIPIFWFAFSVLGATILGQGSMAWLLKRHPVSTITPLMLGTPVVSALSSHFYFGTALTVLMVVGGAIALAGVLIVSAATPRPSPDVNPDLL
jgi:O-acetylserine/cysteine efflux transporter